MTRVGCGNPFMQDRRQRQLRRRHRRLALRALLVGPGQLGLKVDVEQLVAVLPQPDKQLGPADQPHDQALWEALDQLTVPYGKLTVTLRSLIDSGAWK
jgi:hypothetical protein